MPLINGGVIDVIVFEKVMIKSNYSPPNKVLCFTFLFRNKNVKQLTTQTI